MNDELEFIQNSNQVDYFSDEENISFEKPNMPISYNEGKANLGESISTQLSMSNRFENSHFSNVREDKNYSSQLQVNMPSMESPGVSVEYEKLLKCIIDKGEILNSIIISENNNFIDYVLMKIINNNLSKNKKVCHLVSELKKAQNIYEFYKDKPNINPIILQKNKGKKNKNDFQSFSEQISENNVFLVLPNVFYKLLSIGFVKIYNFGLIIFEDCHLCDSNHPYNIIMQEFYFYYYIFHKNTIKFLPKIIGFTNSIYKDKNIVKNDKKCGELLKTISENLDCQVILDSSVLEDKGHFNNDIEYIQVDNFMKEKNKVDGINAILMKFFFEDMLNLCLDYYIHSYGETAELNRINKEEIKLKYLNTLKAKFNSDTFEKYNSVETSERSLHFLSQNSIFFRAFEDIQKHLINIIQNLDLEEIYYLFIKYKNLYEVNYKKQIEDIYLKNLYKKFLFIFKVNIHAFKRLLDKSIEYKTDRLTKFMNKLFSIYDKNNSSKILIFVPNRKAANILYNYLDRDNKDNIFKNKSKFIIGINSKKEENTTLTLATRISICEINERVKEYFENKINILICTPPALEHLTKQKCDYILIYSELSKSNNDYEKVKEKAKNCQAKLIIFGNGLNKIEDSLKEKKDKELEQLKSLFMENNILENQKNFRDKNFIERKNLDKNIYYYIDKTEAKISLKNCMTIFNEIYNLYFSKGVKINVNKKTKAYEKEQKFECCISFQLEGDNVIQLKSKKHNDKQNAESECYLEYIMYLHQKKLIDDNFRVKI